MGNTAGTQIPRTPRQPQFVREHPVATMGLMGCGLLVALGILFRLVLMSLSIILWMLKARNLVNYVVQPDCLAQRKYRLLLHQFAHIRLSAHASRNAKEERFESFLRFSLLHSLFLFATFSRSNFLRTVWSCASIQQRCPFSLPRTSLACRLNGVNYLLLHSTHHKIL